MKKIYLLTFFLILHIHNSSQALSIATHKDINENVVTRNDINGFGLDLYLREKIGLPDGINTIYRFREVWQLFREGGAHEDAPAGNWIPYRRSRNHFHDPLLPVDQAGYTSWGSFCAVGHCPVSAILWALGPQNSDYYLGLNLNPGGDWSWIHVRNFYLSALTSPTESARDANFENAFLGLGHLLHLVQDMSVPEHTRLDRYFHLVWLQDSFHYTDWYQINL